MSGAELRALGAAGRDAALRKEECDGWDGSPLTGRAAETAGSRAGWAAWQGFKRGGEGAALPARGERGNAVGLGGGREKPDLCGRRRGGLLRERGEASSRAEVPLRQCVQHGK